MFCLTYEVSYESLEGELKEILTLTWDRADKDKGLSDLDNMSLKSDGQTDILTPWAPDKAKKLNNFL